MSKTLSPLVSIITINYGGSKNVEQLWASIVQHETKLDYEFIVVDNASPNDDASRLDQIFAGTAAHVIKLEKNLGFGGGYGEGVKFARGTYLAIINPDIKLNAHCLSTLISTLEVDKNIGLVAPKLLSPNGQVQQNARHFPTPWVMFGRRLATKFQWAYDCQPSWYTSKTPVAVDWVQGSFMVTRRTTFVNDLQGFDARFFLFLEDTDLCRRLWQQARRVLLVPTATAVHGEHRLSGGSLWQAWRKKTFWIHLHSALKYFWKYRGQALPDIK